MKEVNFKDLESIKEFSKEGKELVWNPFNVDEFMGFTIYRIRVKEGLNGQTEFRFTEEYIMSGNSNEKDCTEEKCLNRMKNALKTLLESNKK